MQTVNLAQGTQAWLDFRAERFGASEAPAMMGESTYMSREQLLEQKATGITKEVDAATQARFNDGHKIEALARPLAEKVIGEELYPVTGFDGEYSASFDGLTLLEDTAWECKTLNNTLREALVDGATGADLPLMYQIQMEHQAMVSGCEKILFTAYDGKDDIRHIWYTPNLDLRKKIVAGWEQFKTDLANWKPTEKTPEAVAEQVEDLPTVFVTVQGALTVSNNLDKFASALDYFLSEILVKEPENDQDFADLEAQIKVLKRAEDELQNSESQLLAQVSAVNDAVQLKNKLYELARQNRLASEKLVKAKKQEIKTKIVFDAQQQIKSKVADVSKELGFSIPAPIDGIAEAIKGKSKLDSIKEAAHNQVLNVLRDFDIYTQEIRQAVKLIDAAGRPHLFADRASLATKGVDFVQLTIKTRLDDEAARIKAAEERAKREAEEKAKREAEAKQRETTGQTKTQISVMAKNQEVTEPASAKKSPRPTPQAIIDVLADYYRVPEHEVVAWLTTTDFATVELAF